MAKRFKIPRTVRLPLKIQNVNINVLKDYFCNGFITAWEGIT